MALASWHVQVIKRSAGRSAVAAAAYRSAQTLSDDRTGLTHSYTRKQDVVYTKILAPEGASEWVFDPAQLWNRSEASERRGDAQVAREVRIALPRELTREQNIELSVDFARTFVAQGMVAHVSVHDGKDRNPHSHIMLTMRPLDGDNFSKKKNRDWNKTERLLEWHNEYERITNQYLERYGHEERIDVRSYAEQGIERIPTIHLGSAAYYMEQRGIETDRGNINRDIEKANREIEEINRQIENLRREIEIEKESINEQIERYRKTGEAVKRTLEALGHRLSEDQKQNFVRQLENTQKAIQYLQQSSPELVRDSAPVASATPEKLSPVEDDGQHYRAASSPQPYVPGQEEEQEERPSVPVASPSPEEPSMVEGDGPHGSPSHHLTQAMPEQEEPVHHATAGGMARKRGFLPEWPVPESPEPSQEVSRTGQTGFPPSGEPRQPDVLGPSGRPFSPAQIEIEKDYINAQIARCRKAIEEIQRTAEVLGPRLSEHGNRSLSQQLKNEQEALKRFQQSYQELERISAPVASATPEKLSPVEGDGQHDRAASSPQPYVPGHEEPSGSQVERPSAPVASTSPEEPSTVEDDGPHGRPSHHLTQAMPQQEEHAHHAMVGGMVRRRGFLPEELVPVSPELSGSQGVSGTTDGQTRSPPSGEPRQPDVGDRPFSPAQEEETPPHERPLSRRGQKEQDFTEPDSEIPSRTVPQPKEVSAHHSRLPREGEETKLSHHDLLRKLKKEHEEKQKERNRDDDRERQK